jgi:hypothetical protein
MGINYLVKIKWLNIRDLERIDSRVISANNINWKEKASQFRINLINNTNEELLTIVHDYPNTQGYKLVELPIITETKVLLFCNDANQNSTYTPYQIEFFNRDQLSLKKITIEADHVRNMFIVKVPSEAISLDYSIGEEDFNHHDYDHGFECTRCKPLNYESD